MRTSEERIAAMHLRAAEIKKEKDRKNANILSSVAVVTGLAAVIVMGILMPGLTDKVVVSGVYDGYSASIFAGSGAIGFIVVGILSFLLGAAVTIFCFKLRKLSNLNKKGPGEDQ